MVGGGSTVNGMLYVRGDQEDYDAWHRWVGERVWVMEDPLGSWWSDSMKCAQEGQPWLGLEGCPALLQAL